jgi:hypothetical protein
MAFPAIYDFNYYKGDTFEFRIYPKKNDGTVFPLRDFANELNSFMLPTDIANTPDYVSNSSSAYDSAQFTIAKSRGSITSTAPEDQPIRCFARVSDDGTYVLCAIRPSDADKLVAGTEYVYDVEVRRPSSAPGSGSYELVYTLVTGKITITDQITGANAETRTTLSDFTISGLTPPTTCANPDMDIIHETSEYTAQVMSWQGISNPSTFEFAPDTEYTAVIRITPKSPYQLKGTPKNKFTVEGATVTHPAYNTEVSFAEINAKFPKTEKVVSILSIDGVTPPVSGETPVTSVAATIEYTVSLSWKEKSLTDPVVYENFSGEFKPSRTYAAQILLTPKSGYTLCTGIEEDSFSVVGALNYTNSANSGIVIAEFPQTMSPTPVPSPVAPTPVPAPIALPTPVPAPIALPTPVPAPIAETPTVSPFASPTPVPSSPTPVALEGAE